MLLSFTLRKNSAKALWLKLGATMTLKKGNNR